MLGRALKMAFWVVYDHTGKLLAANLLWALIVLVPGSIAASCILSGNPAVQLFLGVPGALLTALAGFPVMAVGVAHMAKQLIERKDGSLGDLFAGIRLYWRRAIGVGGILAIALTCLTTSVWFYASKLNEVAPILGYALSALALWGVLLVLLTGLYAFPALAQKRAGVVATLKLSILLVLANPFLSIGLGLQVCALGVIALLLPPFLFFLYGSVVMVLMSSAYELLARKYATPDSAEGPTKTIAPDDSQDDYLNRGVRDALFPWKG